LPFTIFFEKHSELRKRALQDQLPRSSALNLLINAISMWNTIYLSEAIKALKKKEHFVGATPVSSNFNITMDKLLLELYFRE